MSSLLALSEWLKGLVPPCTFIEQGTHQRQEHTQPHSSKTLSKTLNLSGTYGLPVEFLLFKKYYLESDDRRRRSVLSEIPSDACSSGSGRGRCGWLTLQAVVDNSFQAKGQEEPTIWSHTLHGLEDVRTEAGESAHIEHKRLFLLTNTLEQIFPQHLHGIRHSQYSEYDL